MNAETTSRPLPFSKSMIIAVVEGRKTQTRRLVRWPKAGRWLPSGPTSASLDNLGDCVTVVATDLNAKQHFVECPTGGEGDSIWVREAYRLPAYLNNLSPAEAISRHGDKTIRKVASYIADEDMDGRINGEVVNRGRYRHGRFMPAALSRLTLDVAEFPTIERLRAISEEDALAEGIVRRDLSEPVYGLPEWPLADFQLTARRAFLALFRSINPEVEGDPWVWKTTFKLRAA